MNTIFKSATILFWIIFLTVPCSGQENNFSQYQKTKIIPKLSVIKGKQWIGEIGLYRINYTFLSRLPVNDELPQDGLRYHLRNNFMASNMRGFYISTEIFSFEDEMFWGPKIGYELTTLAPTFASAIGIEVIYYTNGDELDSFAIAPKIGIPFGFLNFFYSYNWYTNDNFNSISGAHQIQLSFNMDFKTMKIKKKMLKDQNKENQKPKDMILIQNRKTVADRPFLAYH